jgi:hypothetical protein
MSLMDQVPVEELPKVDVEGLKADMRRGGPPTADDVTILRDGTRLDTPAKIRAWVNELVREHRRRVHGVAR